jgi:blue copper oxidase
MEGSMDNNGSKLSLKARTDVGIKRAREAGIRFGRPPKLTRHQQDHALKLLATTSHSWRPVLKINQPAATLWFHPHPHHDTARQIYMGLTGMIIVDDGSDGRLNLPRTYGVDDLPIILQDRSFEPDGSIGYDNNDLNALDIAYGARGDTIIVNGAIAPVAKVPSGLVRLRLLNAANAQNFDLRFRDRRTFHVIVSDGGFLAEPVAVNELIISPAERFEILVDFADGKAVVLETGPDKEMGECPL